jgi:hypothetical protein
LIVCYQVDDRAILGLTRTASAGYDDPKGSGDYNCFDLVPSRNAWLIDPPLPIEVLRANGVNPEAFLLGRQGTVFPMSAREFSGLVRTLRRHQPELSESLGDWLRAADALGAFGVAESPQKESGDLDRELSRLERDLKNRSDVYVRRKVEALIRKDAPLIRALKARYQYRCQFPRCAVVIPMRNGRKYCEVAHVKGVADGGRAIRANLVVLCPNHHKMLDYGEVRISVSTKRLLKGMLNAKRFLIRR